MGVELTSVGLPVIVAGEAWIRNKGLTHDASSPEEYFQHPRPAAVSPSGLGPAQLARARRYAYHFFFNRMIPLPFIEPKAGYPDLPPEARAPAAAAARRIRRTGHDLRRHPGQAAVRPARPGRAARRSSSQSVTSTPVVIAVLSFVIAAAAAVVRSGARGAPRGAASIGAVVPPRPDRWHSAPTPTMGGIAIAAGDDRRLHRRRAGESDRRVGELGVGAGAAGRAGDVRRRLPRRPPAAVAARQAGGVAGHRRVPRLRARRRRARRRAAAHATR